MVLCINADICKLRNVSCRLVSLFYLFVFWCVGCMWSSVWACLYMCKIRDHCQDSPCIILQCLRLFICSLSFYLFIHTFICSFFNLLFRDRSVNEPGTPRFLKICLPGSYQPPPPSSGDAGACHHAWLFMRVLGIRSWVPVLVQEALCG